VDILFHHVRMTFTDRGALLVWVTEFEYDDNGKAIITIIPEKEIERTRRFSYAIGVPTKISTSLIIDTKEADSDLKEEAKIRYSEHLDKQIEIAKRIATIAHRGAFDKAGVEYIKHPESVASFCISRKDKAIAYLHDVIEDTPITAEDIRRAGIDEDILQATLLLTKGPQIDLELYHQKIALNWNAYKVKLADMQHNCDVRRFKNPTSPESVANSLKYVSRRVDLVTKRFV